MCNEDFDDFYDAEREAMDDEAGAALGDPRRCLHHPSEVISSPDGMFDGVCGLCEAAMAEGEETWCPLPSGHPALPPAPVVVVPADDDIPF